MVADGIKVLRGSGERDEGEIPSRRFLPSRPLTTEEKTHPTPEVRAVTPSTTRRESDGPFTCLHPDKCAGLRDPTVVQGN